MYKKVVVLLLLTYCSCAVLDTIAVVVILVSIENNISGVPNYLQNIYSTKYSLLHGNFNNSRTETENSVERPRANT